jgi:hypothetical protein
MKLDPEVFLIAAESMLLCGGAMSTEYAIERTLVYPEARKRHIKEYNKYLRTCIVDAEREHGTIALLLLYEIVKDIT